MIGWYVHHEGRGHLVRARSIARRLRMPVTGLSSLPRPEGWPGAWLRLPRDDHDDGGGLRDVDAKGVLHWAPTGHAGLAARAAGVTGWVAAVRPSLVVVDVSVEVTLLSRLAGAPVVVLAMPGDRLDPVHRLAYDLAETLLAPWPDGTHTDDWPASWAAKVRCVGGISQFDGRPAPPVHRRGGRVLLLWGAGGRAVTPADVAAAREATPGWTWVERSPARPSPDLWRELHECDVVVTHAGQNAVADVAAARAPAVVVAQPRPHGEQVATARAVHRTGAAVGVETWPRASEWPPLLEAARERGGARWAGWSSGHGAADAAAALEGLARDLSAPATA